MLVVMLFGLVPAPQPVVAASTCDWAQFVADVTVQDGTSFKAGDTFDKTWKLKNIGTCTWSKDYSLFFVDGKQMGDNTSVKLTGSVTPGSTVDLTVKLTAPATDGTFLGNWQLKNASGVAFGIGASANKSFWVKIKVGTTDTSTGYDFVAKSGDAAWSSGAGTLTFPGTDGDAKGFGIKQDAPKLENNTSGAPGLLMAPQNLFNGYVQAKYPAFTVQNGDHFQSIFSCEYNATSCYVNFRINYQIGDGAVQTFKSFNETYEGQYYPANYDISSLAGKDVKFILFIGAAGYATGDRAIWGAPRITRGGGVTPTNTPVPTPVGTTATPTVAPSASDRVTFIKDKTYPDGSVVAPGAAFTKTWTIKNTGTSTWTNKYSLAYISGEKIGGADVLLTSTVLPNTTIDVSVNLTAPAANGSYKGFWMLKNDKGAAFGLGSAGDKPWWVDVVVRTGVTPVATNTPVVTNTPVPSGTTVFDFTADPKAATWSGSAGALTFPGTEDNINGFAIKLDSVKMETGSTDTRPSLLTVPPDADSTYIQGMYPAFAVQANDRFQATIGCQDGATSCDIFYRLDYKIGDGPVVTNFWIFHEKFDHLVKNVNFSLGALAGQNVQFILTVTSAGAGSGDRAVWIAPRITR